VGRINKDVYASNTDILKDWNIIFKRKSHDILNFSVKHQKTILDQMKIDAEFLKAHQLMDYSLLLAVENNFAKYHQDKLLKNQV